MHFLQAVEEFTTEFKIVLTKTSLALSLLGLTISYIAQNRLALLGFALSTLTSGIAFWQSKEVKAEKELAEKMGGAIEEIRELVEVNDEIQKETKDLSLTAHSLARTVSQMHKITELAKSTLEKIPKGEDGVHSDLVALKNRIDRVANHYSGPKKPAS